MLHAECQCRFDAIAFGCEVVEECCQSISLLIGEKPNWWALFWRQIDPAAGLETEGLFSVEAVPVPHEVGIDSPSIVQILTGSDLNDTKNTCRRNSNSCWLLSIRLF